MNYPLLDNNLEPLPLILIIVGGALLLIASIVFIFILLKRKNSKKDHGSVWLEALGGKENIEDISGVGSRVTLILNNKEIINREQLKTLGVSSVLTMANKIILVIENKAEKIADIIRQEL